MAYRRFKRYSISLIFYVVARLAIFDLAPRPALVPFQLFRHRFSQLLIAESGAAGCVPYQHEDIGELANVIRRFGGLDSLFRQMLERPDWPNVTELAIRPLRVLRPNIGERVGLHFRLRPQTLKIAPRLRVVLHLTQAR
ncbi:hypothetical protein KPP2020_037 [Klebsiella phage KPP2020]|uniref:Uncharacterized protein n=1 Tax=Klebsiella phage KPP2020 TaxID=3017288 RepID=A0AAE9YA06_9CAUD|nr:hypothetical protein KPP2020_037 [Klebsiella phage KPP2020]